jgi:predicted ATPase
MTAPMARGAGPAERGRAWRDQGRNAAAQELLAPVHAWFTEGHDLSDLIEARALLDQLA